MRFVLLVLAILPFVVTSARSDATAEIHGKALTLSVDTRPATNLIYQLDCMGGLIHCAPDIYQSLWHKDLGFNADDEKQLDEWRKLRTSFTQRNKSEDGPREIGASFPIPATEDRTIWS